VTEKEREEKSPDYKKKWPQWWCMPHATSPKHERWDNNGSVEVVAIVVDRPCT